MKSVKNTVDTLDADRVLQELKTRKKSISVTGLGYVGLPLALELATKFNVIGFDISSERVKKMQQSIDPSNELPATAFHNRSITFTSDPAELAKASFHIVAVPTPVDESRTPNLKPLLGATASVGRHLRKGDIVVYESTVYPGCTEEDCVPLLEKESGLTFGEDFTVGYSPERINPGDKKHTITSITKVVSASDEPTLKVVAGTYGEIITAGIYPAKSIKVAEAAKVIENSQRDVNISFVNELSIIFRRLGIDTQDVLDAASTKWNFLPFRPGLVGGHCISVDPYYLLHKSLAMGYDPQVIASGRRINDGMPAFIAKELVQLLLRAGKNPNDCNVLVLGVTFKENVTDIRNSKVVDMIREMSEFGLNVDLVDPYADPEEVMEKYQLPMTETVGENYDAIIVAVAHEKFSKYSLDYFRKISQPEMVLFDLKGIYSRDELREGEVLWRL
ncbi:nucleotide sugar dehydrogenase [Neolewinella agarilytica]|uniref:UDP-N-acetyl-D-galactosamine dehydrogenase n=1 Tax=Neolewinella agarilytica TaxID=478744 RepID=A0A1H9DXK4_9BACT|nr:nucleotide sugar dehydrogenase [Neolewinella agarilytica]SEQ18191.1 UDP-N-acetyl-D-galactosamine dehydrogenase [Neolewinella agarilytica]